MRLRWLIVLALAGVALVGGGTGSGATTPECSDSGTRVCADLVGSPATVPPTDAESPHFISYVSHISNDGNPSATHATADVDLSAGMVLVSASTSVGTCSVAGQPTCVLGRLASGAKATVEFVAQAPRRRRHSDSLADDFLRRAGERRSHGRPEAGHGRGHGGYRGRGARRYGRLVRSERLLASR